MAASLPAYRDRPRRLVSAPRVALRKSDVIFGLLRVFRVVQRARTARRWMDRRDTAARACRAAASPREDPPNRGNVRTRTRVGAAAAPGKTPRDAEGVPAGIDTDGTRTTGQTATRRRRRTRDSEQESQAPQVEGGRVLVRLDRHRAWAVDERCVLSRHHGRGEDRGGGGRDIHRSGQGRGAGPAPRATASPRGLVTMVRVGARSFLIRDRTDIGQAMRVTDGIYVAAVGVRVPVTFHAAARRPLARRALDHQIRQPGHRQQHPETPVTTKAFEAHHASPDPRNRTSCPPGAEVPVAREDLEQLVDLGTALSLVAPAERFRHASIHVRTEDDLPHLSESALCGRDLEQDVDAILTFFDHPSNRADLAFDPAESRQDLFLLGSSEHGYWVPLCGIQVNALSRSRSATSRCRSLPQCPHSRASAARIGASRARRGLPPLGEIPRLSAAIAGRR